MNEAKIDGTPVVTQADAEKVTGPAQAKQKRGFACMDRAKVSAIASKGGKAAHLAGTAHEFSTDQAKAAGAKGGKISGANRTAKRLARVGGELVTNDATFVPPAKDVLERVNAKAEALEKARATT